MSQRVVLLVALAGLVLGLLAGVAFERRGETYRVREVRGYVSAINPDGSSVCLSETPTSSGGDCQNPRLVPGEEVPPIGTRVRAGFVFLPSQEGCCSGSWLYLIPEPE
jgi:hypothetical protein